MSPRIRAALVAFTLAGCGGSVVTEYARLDALAERAYAAGRYDEAALRFRDAANRARRTADRDEAVYRQAASLRRGRRNAEAIAVLDELLRASPHGDRAARAAYDRALALADLGEGERADAALDDVLRTYPDEGVAVAALHRRLARLAELGEGAVREYLVRMLPELAATELGEQTAYAFAESLEHSGELAAARDRYLEVAARYPYPKGALWDDALFRAADLDARLGEPRNAIRHLEQMLRERETSYVQGSYERGRYAEAQYRIAELYRDALGERDEARRAFERLWSAHPSSRLRDDAAWNAAVLALESGDREAACRDVASLVREMPDSRYAACAPHLCPSLRPRGRETECHAYLLREGSENEGR
jgi:tetratricopeptide (TPR) repeat protein